VYGVVSSSIMVIIATPNGGSSVGAWILDSVVSEEHGPSDSKMYDRATAPLPAVSRHNCDPQALRDCEDGIGWDEMGCGAVWRISDSDIAWKTDERK
jgi:hypothetical protein